MSFQNKFQKVIKLWKVSKIIWNFKLTKRLSNKFNVSVSEVDHQDIHEQIVIGVTSVATTKEVLYSLKEKILDFVEDNTDAELVKIEEEIIDY